MKPVALITGATRGIGRALAEAFAPDHRLALTYHTTPPGAVGPVPADALAIKADLAEQTSPAHVISEVISHFGQIDLIINNAGALLSDAEDEGQNFAVNAAAPAALLEAALPHLTPGATVITISSVNARLPAMGALSYSASKAAVETWTRGMAKTLGPKGIRVNAIAPGAIERPESPRDPELVAKFVEMTALGRVGTPEDIAKVARFLASDAAGFITGEVITVSGGYRL